MIRPSNFGYNSETAKTNIFQKQTNLSQKIIQKNALLEFEKFANILRENEITVEIFDDTSQSFTPDSIFPNNWFSAHRNGLLIIYPMLAQNRRIEKRKDIIAFLKSKCCIKKIVDLSSYEKENKFLEGTGSLVFDHKNRNCYANISSRTNENLARKVCQLLGYKAITFRATDTKKNEIYHTNVMMSIGSGYSIICIDSIKNSSEKTRVKNSFKKSGMQIVKISLKQMNSFCGNTLELQNERGENILVMSENAYKAFRKNQIKILEKYAKIIYSGIETIETVGGGSARCMMAEISPSPPFTNGREKKGI